MIKCGYIYLHGRDYIFITKINDYLAYYKVIETRFLIGVSCDHLKFFTNNRVSLMSVIFAYGDNDV